MATHITTIPRAGTRTPTRVNVGRYHLMDLVLPTGMVPTQDMVMVRVDMAGMVAIKGMGADRSWDPDEGEICSRIGLVGACRLSDG